MNKIIEELMKRKIGVSFHPLDSGIYCTLVKHPKHVNLSSATAATAARALMAALNNLLSEASFINELNKAINVTTLCEEISSETIS